MNRIRIASILPVALTLGILAQNNRAAVINQTYSGTFPANISGTLPNQGTALEEAFTLTSTSAVTISTSSYATGGFEPNLMLYDSGGHYLMTGLTPGSSPVAKKDPSTGLALDAYLTDSGLPGGTYTVALMDFLLGQTLTATNLSDGFTLNFGSGVGFTDEMGNTRTGAYALTINAVSASAVPEPATLWLAAPLLAGLALRARKRTS